MVDKKEILRTVSNTGIYRSSDKVGTVYPIQNIFKKSHRQHPCTLELRQDVLLVLLQLT